MLWPKHPEFSEFIADTDLVIMFVGAMESEDTEKLDRRCADLNQNYEMFINFAVLDNKKVVVVNQSGSAMTFGDNDIIVQTKIASAIYNFFIYVSYN